MSMQSTQRSFSSTANGAGPAGARAPAAGSFSVAPFRRPAPVAGLPGTERLAGQRAVIVVAARRAEAGGLVAERARLGAAVPGRGAGAGDAVVDGEDVVGGEAEEVDLGCAAPGDGATDPVR